jgi:hypothetical protein
MLAYAAQGLANDAEEELIAAWNRQNPGAGQCGS